MRSLCELFKLFLYNQISHCFNITKEGYNLHAKSEELSLYYYFLNLKGNTSLYWRMTIL